MQVVTTPWELKIKKPQESKTLMHSDPKACNGLESRIPQLFVPQTRKVAGMLLGNDEASDIKGVACLQS